MSDTKDNGIAFVRTEFLEQAAPPATEAGIIKWVRTNLFSGPFNTIMTLLALFFIYKIVSGAYPWFANGIWDAESIRECRDKLTASGAKTGACFAVLVDRWDHLMFGF